MNGLYQVSDSGEVRNSKKRILKPEYSNKGYACVQLRRDGKIKKHRIHRLVAELFIPNPNNLPEVNHKDENKSNNEASNLEWCTHKENMNSYKENHPDAVCNEKAVYCFDLDEYYKSASEASVHTGVCRTSIVKCCNHKLQQAGGMLWCYAKDKNTKFPTR